MNWLFLVQKAIFMSRHLGGKQTILKFVMRIHLKIRDIFISWMEREFDMNWLPLQRRLKAGEICLMLMRMFRMVFAR